MSYLNQCPDCGAALDPGEKCDCQETELPAIVCTQPPVIYERIYRETYGRAPNF